MTTDAAVAALASGIERLAHGRCCWEPKQDAADLLAALTPDEARAVVGELLTVETLAEILHRTGTGCVYGTRLRCDPDTDDHLPRPFHVSQAHALIDALRNPGTPDAGTAEEEK